ncbi:MAG TPA: SIMPL domain-containing protein [Patescibacteria group bacterium]
MNKVHVDTAGGVIVFFILLFLYTKFIGPIPFAVNSINTTKQNLFQAQGTGEVSAIPNTADISLGVTKTAASVTDAQNQTNTAVTNILNAIKALGIDAKDIKTTNYSVNPQYNYNAGSQTITGYSVTQNIEVKLSPIEKASKAIDVATANGANLVGGLTFTLDNTTLQKLEDQARQKAVDAAKQKAQSLANAAGMKLGKIVDVEETPNEIPMPRPLLVGMGAAKTDSAPTELPTGQSTISSTVTISYETY